MGSSHFLLTPALPVPVHKLLTQVMLFELLGQSRRHETRNSENTSDVFPSLSHTLRLHPNDPCRFHLGHGFRIKMEAPVLFRNTRHPTCWV